MHNQRILRVLFSSRQRRISSFLKSSLQDPANSFPTFHFSQVVFSQFDDSLKFPSHLSSEALKKKKKKKWKDQQERPTTTRMTAEA